MLGAPLGQDLFSNATLMKFGVTLPEGLLTGTEGLGDGLPVLGADVQQRQVRLAA